MLIVDQYFLMVVVFLKVHRLFLGGNNDFTFGTGDFALEMWIYPWSVQLKYYMMVED